MTAIDPVSRTNTLGAATQPTSASAAGAASLGTDYDTFLNLLTAQLRNQDPLDPTDPTEFVSQLTQFSQLEQSVAQTAQLEELAALERNASALSGLNFLGRDVEAYSNRISLSNGTAAFSYEVLAPGDSMEVRVYDDNDKLIATLGAEKTAGRHSLVWDGVMDNGADADAGLYRAELVAVTGEERTPAGQIIITDRVEELRFGAAGAELSLQSGLVIGSASILSVKDVPPAVAGV